MPMNEDAALRYAANILRSLPTYHPEWTEDEWHAVMFAARQLDSYRENTEQVKLVG